MPCSGGFYLEGQVATMHIAIIGAGLSGLVCARALVAQGHTVVVYEKNAAVGGRTGTQHTELGGFDHGAQYFTARSDAFKAHVVEWRKSGWIKPWEGKLVALEDGQVSAAGREAERALQRFVAVPGMYSLAEQLAQGLDVRCEQWAKRIEPSGSQMIVRVSNDGTTDEASAGPFDAVVVATPAVRAHPLLQGSPEFSRQAESALFAPCWVMMLGFQQPLDLGFDGAWVHGSRLSWIARDSSKPMRRAGEHWVCHATRDWSMEHYNDDDDRVRDKMLKAFHTATGSEIQPVYVSMHRWRFAQAIDPIDANCLWDGDKRLGACGDWFACGLDGAGRVENAVLSGLALAQAIG